MNIMLEPKIFQCKMNDNELHRVSYNILKFAGGKAHT